MKIDSNDFILTGRGSTALWAILKSLNKRHCKVLIPANICEIVIPIIHKAGMIPVYYDVDEALGISNLTNIIESYQGDEVALLAVHNFGLPLDIEAIASWAKEKNIFVIEDVCNAIGATYKNVPLGWWGDASIFSFGFAKIIEYGVGGALIIKDKNFEKEVLKTLTTLGEYSDFHKNKDIEFQTRLRQYRLDPKLQTPSIYCPLYNEYSSFLLYTISDLTKSNIKNEIIKLDENLNRRAEKALQYRTGITSSKISHLVEKNGQVYWRYNLLVEPSIKQDLVDELRKNKMLVSTWYPPVIELFEEKFNPSDFKGSVSFYKKIINLFVDFRVSENDILQTIKIINNFK